MNMFRLSLYLGSKVFFPSVPVGSLAAILSDPHSRKAYIVVSSNYVRTVGKWFVAV
jgi:hypothetical protein